MQKRERIPAFEEVGILDLNEYRKHPYLIEVVLLNQLKHSQLNAMKIFIQNDDVSHIRLTIN